MLLTCAYTAMLHVIVGKMADSDVYRVYACNMKRILCSFEILITMCILSMSPYKLENIFHME